jgi:hypothetical protein
VPQRTYFDDSIDWLGVIQKVAHSLEVDLAYAARAALHEGTDARILTNQLERFSDIIVKCSRCFVAVLAPPSRCGIDLLRCT